MANYVNDTTGNFSPVNPRQLALATKSSQRSSGGNSMFDDIMSMAGPAMDAAFSGKRSGGMGAAVISAATGGLGSSSKFLSFGGGSSKNLNIDAPPGFGSGGVGNVGGLGGGAGGDFNNFIDQSNLQQMDLLRIQFKMNESNTVFGLLTNLEKSKFEITSRVIQNIRQG